jgi:hypothetical protein
MYANMFKLDFKGRMVHTVRVEYHSWAWMLLVETGWITYTVDL